MDAWRLGNWKVSGSNLIWIPKFCWTNSILFIQLNICCDILENPSSYKDKPKTLISTIYYKYINSGVLKRFHVDPSQLLSLVLREPPWGRSTRVEVCQLVDTYFGQLRFKSPFLSLAHYSCSPLSQGQLWRDKEKVFDLIRNGIIRQSDMDGTTFIFHAIMSETRGLYILACWESHYGYGNEKKF